MGRGLGDYPTTVASRSAGTGAVMVIASACGYELDEDETTTGRAFASLDEARRWAIEYTGEWYRSSLEMACEALEYESEDRRSWNERICLWRQRQRETSRRLARLRPGQTLTGFTADNDWVRFEPVPEA